MFPITGYKAACTGSAVNLNEAPNTPLLDNTPIQTALTVNGYDPTSVAALIEVPIDITHSDPTDLVVTLTSPAGTTITLWDRGSSVGENLVGTFPTTLSPVDSLSSIAQENMDGSWVLTVEDVDVGPIVREGVLNSWGIKLTEYVKATRSKSPITVSGLTNRREYSCTVAPVTNLGTAPRSNAVSATPVAGTADCSQEDYVLLTQAEVDAFPQSCDSVRSITLGYPSSPQGPSGPSDIANLDSLSGLTSVEGGFTIWVNNDLTTLAGLDNLNSVGGFFIIEYNSALVNLDGLSGLTSVGATLQIASNASLINLDDLRNLISVGDGLMLENNDTLNNCQGVVPLLGWPSGPANVGNFIQIFSNGSDCNSVAVILASVSGPSQPVINTATGGNESISLGFALSTTTDTLFPVTSYEAVCSGLTEIETAMGIGSPINVGNLTNFREYACTIAPVTGLGTLPLSSSVSATPMPVTEAPSAPQITDIEPGNAQITISVSVADDGGSPITGYTAYCFGLSHFISQNLLNYSSKLYG